MQKITRANILKDQIICTGIETSLENFIDKVKSEVSEIKGIAYCVGSIDLKPLKMVKEEDFQKCNLTFLGQLQFQHQNH